MLLYHTRVHSLKFWLASVTIEKAWSTMRSSVLIVIYFSPSRRLWNSIHGTATTRMSDNTCIWAIKVQAIIHGNIKLSGPAVSI